MPLIIAVVFIVFFVYRAFEKNGQLNKDSKRYDSNLRKTNGRLENLRFLYWFYDQNKTVQEAAELASKDVIQMGFESCISVNAYLFKDSVYLPSLDGKRKSNIIFRGTPSAGYFDYFISDEELEKYDSASTTLLKESYKFQGLGEERVESRQEFGKYQGHYFSPPPEMYYEFPKDNFHFDQLVETRRFEQMSKPPGTRCMYPGLGTSEVVYYSGKYRFVTLRSLETGMQKRVSANSNNINWL